LRHHRLQCHHPRPAFDRNRGCRGSQHWCQPANQIGLNSSYHDDFMAYKEIGADLGQKGPGISPGVSSALVRNQTDDAAEQVGPLLGHDRISPSPTYIRKSLIRPLAVEGPCRGMQRKPLTVREWPRSSTRRCGWPGCASPHCVCQKLAVCPSIALSADPSSRVRSSLSTYAIVQPS